MRTSTLLALTCLLAVYGCATDDNTSDDQQNRTDMKSRADGRQMTAEQFVTQAASSGMFEVQSSQLAKEKQAPAPTLEFAQEMIRDHTKANNELKQIAAQRNIKVPGQMLPRHQQMVDELKSLSGHQFSTRYMTMQNQAHTEAIDLFTRASNQLEDQDLRNFAVRTLPTLKEHRQDAQKLIGGNMPK